MLLYFLSIQGCIFLNYYFVDTHKNKMKYAFRFFILLSMIMSTSSSAQKFIRSRKEGTVVQIHNDTVREPIRINTSSCRPGFSKCEDGYVCCAIGPEHEWWCCSVSDRCGDTRGQCLRPISNNHMNHSQQHHDNNMQKQSNVGKRTL